MNMRAYAPALTYTCVVFLSLMAEKADALDWDLSSAIPGSVAQAAGIAVSENAVHAIWAQSGEEQYARSLDDGVTWQDTLTLSASGANVYNHYIVTSGPVVLAFWRAAAGDAVVFARSSDEGASWGSTSQLGSGTVVLWGVEQEGSQVVVLWSDNRTDTGGDFDYYVSVSPDLGGDMVKSCVWASGGFLGWRDFLGDLGSVLEDDSSHDIG